LLLPHPAENVRVRAWGMTWARHADREGGAQEREQGQS
jgi:hypothetical protein